MNEIFAEYFINEFDDPMNAYTSSMANYNSGINQIATGLPGQQQQQQSSSAPSSAQAATEHDTNTASATTNTHQKMNSSTNNASGISLPTGGIKTAFHMGTTQPTKATREEPPAAKRMKQEDTSQQLQQQQHHPGQAFLAPAGSSSSMQSSVVQGAGGVPLPVGVGIRLGGIGGIAPATAQSAIRPQGGIQTPYTLWAAGLGGAAHLAGVAGQGPGVVSDQAIAERRQRNREHAKRSRVRKKFMLESLQEQVRKLQDENAELRMVVQEHIPDKAMQIINECSTTTPLFTEDDGNTSSAAALTQPGGGGERKATDLERSDFSLMQSLATGQKCFVLSDPKLPDNPIVFATPDFYTMTGYTPKEVLGRNCRFLQGPGTSQRAVEVIRKAVATGSDCTVCLLNYKADGTPFWNQLFVAALRDSDNNIVNYVSSFCLRRKQCWRGGLFILV